VRLWRRRRPSSPAAEAYEDASTPSPETPWRDARYVVVDLETTGVDPDEDEIVSFASFPVDDARVVVGDARSLTIRPERMPGAETIRIHGLRPVDLDGAPALPEVLDEILDALTGRILVAHPAWVERRFLSAALTTGGVRLKQPVLDTEALARHVLGVDVEASARVLSLSDAARRVGLPVHSPHLATGDALTTAQLFIALASRLDRTEPQTLGSLARLSRN
jgi:DNA polymerase-3 subunit epsilon